MLPFILSGLFALAQCAPSTSVHQALHRRAEAQNLVRDLGTLQNFAKSVSGPSAVKANWTKAGADICDWNGVWCDKEAVVGILFNELELKGAIQLDGLINKLPDLQVFHANSNGFSGSIPDLSQLKHLSELDLSNNKYSGSFPSNVFTASNLSFLDLRFNSFKGTVPSKVFDLKNLDVLFLNDNQFTGTIPSEIGNFAGSLLTLANNQLEGSIPSTFINAKNLQQVLLLGNKLSGTLPSGLGSMANLDIFDASNNQLTGTVPEDLCANKVVTSIVLTGNKFNKTLGKECTKAKKAGILQI